MTLTTQGVAAASPYLKKLNEHIKVIVNEVMDDEDEEQNGTNTSVMDGSTPKATKRTSRGQSQRRPISFDFDAKINQVLSEVGVTAAVYSLAELKSNVNMHEFKIGKIYEKLDRQEQGMIQVTSIMGANKTVLQMEIAEIDKQV